MLCNDLAIASRRAKNKYRAIRNDFAAQCDNIIAISISRRWKISYNFSMFIVDLLEDECGQYRSPSDFTSLKVLRSTHLVVWTFEKF